jgi:hypothetical protein
MRSRDPACRQHEAPCGVHALRFVVPPDAPSYAAEVWLVHVDGEGMHDPPTPRLFPINLMTKQDGPVLYNIPVRGFTGRLRAPAAYVRDTPDARGDAYDLGEAARPRMSVPTGARLLLCGVCYARRPLWPVRAR